MPVPTQADAEPRPRAAELFPRGTPRAFLLLGAGIWTLIIAFFLGLAVHYARQEELQVALNRARESFRKDVSYRAWATERGGLYVPLDEKTPPNPWLQVPDREVTTSTGKVLTLVNPAYMTRMVHELGAKSYGLQGHVTSLRPIRPQNGPDPWERKALQAFETGAREFWEADRSSGTPTLNFMGAFIVQQGCLRCHAVQGYKVGDVRGGIRVSVPLGEGLPGPWAHAHRNATAIALVTLWLLGLGGILLWARREKHLRVERGRALDELGESRALYQSLAEDLPVSLFRRDREGRHTYLNPTLVKDLGRPAEELVGLLPQDIYEKETAAALLEEDRQVLEGGSLHRVRPVRIQGREATRLWEVVKIPIRNAAGEVVGLQGVSWDVTEHRQAEEDRHRLEGELEHMQRLESLGRLAGGVAHDMNNVLAAIMALGSVLQGKGGGDPWIGKAADNILHAAERGRDLVKGLTTFARKQMEEARPLGLNELVRQEAALLQRTTLQQVQLQLDLCEAEPWVRGEPTSLGTALMNLCVNALDAMPRGGILRITTRSLGEGLASLAVSDTGEGMPPEVLAKALEPFFTTKPSGKGTGLGLSMVYGTMKAHGGRVDLTSVPGEGTRVTLTFPTLAGPEEGPHPAASPLEGGARQRRLLLVDDDALIRTSVPPLLEAMGHAVQVASGGLEALRRLEAGLQVDLLLLDLNMPGMGGAETLGRARLLRPDLPVLVVSGYLDEAALRILGSYSAVKFLRKPFSRQELVTLLDSFA